MAQRQFRSDDTDLWTYGFGSGSDGAYTPSTGTQTLVDSACSGTAASKSLSATNVGFAAGQLILIHQTRGTGAGAWELNKIDSYTAGTITTAHDLMNTYTNSGASVAQVIVLNQYSSALIDTGVTLTGKAWNGTVGGIIPILANGDITVNGTIAGNGLNGSTSTSTAAGGAGIGYRGGAGTRTSTNGTCQCGEGTAGAPATQTAKNGSGGGGASASANAGVGNGACGGNGTAGSNATGGQNTHVNGTGGDAVGVASLVTMLPGAGGGGGIIADTNTSYTGAGGGGGGAILLLIGRKITFANTVNLNGGTGGSGTAGAGGGAGGSALLKAIDVVLGTNKLTASGGAAGAGGTGNSGNGGVGRIHADYSGTISGETTPTIDSTLDLTIRAGGPIMVNFL